MAGIQIKDSGGIIEYLLEARKRMDDLTPANREIGEIVLASVQENFAKEGRPAWKPLSKVTIADRIRRNKWPGKILNRSGAYGLLGSVNYRATKDSVTVGTALPYATTMQFGAKKGKFGSKSVTIKAHTRKRKGKSEKVKSYQRRMNIPWGDIPARPFLILQIQDEEDIKEILLDYIKGR